MKWVIYSVVSCLYLSCFSCNDKTSIVVKQNQKNSKSEAGLSEHEMPFDSIIQGPSMDSLIYKNYLSAHETALQLSIGMPIEKVREVCQKFSIETKTEGEFTYLALDLNDDGSPEKNTTYEPWPESKPFPVTPHSPTRGNHVSLTFKANQLASVSCNNPFYRNYHEESVETSLSDKIFEVSIAGKIFKIVIIERLRLSFRVAYIMHDEKYFWLYVIADILNDELEKLSFEELDSDDLSSGRNFNVVKYRKGGKTYQSSLNDNKPLLRLMRVLAEDTSKFSFSH